jgi:hypothetical protein
MVEQNTADRGGSNRYQAIPTVWMGMHNTMLFCATRGGKTAPSGANSGPIRSDERGAEPDHQDKYADK